MDDIVVSDAATATAAAGEGVIASPLDLLGGYATEFAEPSWTWARDLNAFDSWSALSSGAGTDSGGFGFHHANDGNGGGRDGWGVGTGGENPIGRGPGLGW
jgi:hypothetical protein